MNPSYWELYNISLINELDNNIIGQPKKCLEMLLLRTYLKENFF